jgi:hypothetical protein
MITKTAHQTTLAYGQRFADSIGAIWEVIELPCDREDGNVRLWNRSYNAFDRKTPEATLKMKEA